MKCWHLNRPVCLSDVYCHGLPCLCNHLSCSHLCLSVSLTHFLSIRRRKSRTGGKTWRPCQAWRAERSFSTPGSSRKKAAKDKGASWYKAHVVCLNFNQHYFMVNYSFIWSASCGLHTILNCDLLRLKCASTVRREGFDNSTTSYSYHIISTV